VRSLAWLTESDESFSPSAAVEVRLSRGTVVVTMLDTAGTVDVAAERRRLEKDLAAAEKELAGTTASSATTPSWPRRPRMSSRRSAIAGSWPAKRSTASPRGWPASDE